MAVAAKKAPRPRAEAAAAGSANRSKQKKAKYRSKLPKRYHSSRSSRSRNIIKITRKGERYLHPSRRTKSERPIHTRIQEEQSPSHQSRLTVVYLIYEQMNESDKLSAPAAAEAVPTCANIATVPIEDVDTPRPQVGPKT